MNRHLGAPIIKIKFNKDLLSTGFVSLKQDSKYLFQIFEELEILLIKKTKNGKNKIEKERCEKFKIEFMDIYERIKIKEKELQAKNEHPTQKMFYFIPSIDRKSQTLLIGLTKGRGFMHRLFPIRKSYKVSKIKKR